MLAGGGLGLFLYALSEAPVRGWGSPVVIGTGVAGVAALAGLVAVELRSKAPMLNLRLLRNRIFRTTNLVSVCNLGVYSAYLFLMPEFLQLARGASALSSGLTTFPGAIGVWTSSQIAARIYPRVGPRRMAIGGLCGVITVFCLLGLAVGLDTSIWVIRLLTLCNGFANGFTVIAVQASSFATISPADTGRASALFQTQTRIAGSIGVAVLVTVVSVAAPAGATGAALVPAFHYAFLTAAAITVLAAGFALTIRDADAAATMRRRQAGPGARRRLRPGSRRGSVRAAPTPVNRGGSSATGGQGSVRPASCGASVSWLASGSGGTASGPAEAASGHCLSSTCGISQLARKASAAIGTAIRNTVWIDSA